MPNHYANKTLAELYDLLSIKTGQLLEAKLNKEDKIVIKLHAKEIEMILKALEEKKREEDR